MNGILIIGHNPNEMTHGPDAMANTVQIPDSVASDAKDGEDVEVRVKGTLVEHDGMRFIAAHTVDGDPVEDMGEIETEQDTEPDHSMDSTDALEQFMKNKKG